MPSASECYRRESSYFSQRSIYNTLEELTGFQRNLFYVIIGLNEPHGLVLKDELEEYYGEEIHQVACTESDTLVDKRLIEKGQHDRRINVYTPTRRD